jgi:magnesium-transporting ATPase (P-type)
MLTGDKGLTAKEIGISCGLVTPPTIPDKAHALVNPDAEHLHANNTFEFKEHYEDVAQLFTEIKLTNQESAKFK